MEEQRGDRDQRAAEHQAGLDDVGPDDRLDPAHRGVEAGQHREDDDRDQVGADGGDRLLRGLGPGARDEQAPRQHHHERRDEQPRARGERAHEEEQAGDVVLAPRPEADAEVVVDRVDLVVVVRLEEDVADQHAPEDQPDDDLHVREASRGVALAGHAQERRRARLRRDDRRHHRPPRHAAAREGEIVQAPVAPAHVQADGDDAGEVGDDDGAVDQQLGRGGEHAPLSRRRAPEAPIYARTPRRSRRWSHLVVGPHLGVSL